MTDDHVPDENEDLLSDYSSATTFFDDEQTTFQTPSNSKEAWSFAFYRSEGKLHIFGEWTTRYKAYRYVVVGPDILWVLLTYIVIIVPSFFIYKYFVIEKIERIIFLVILGICIFGLTSAVLIDPGLVRKYHHARSRKWTFCDRCESFRPPGTVHCSTCQVRLSKLQPCLFDIL